MGKAFKSGKGVGTGAGNGHDGFAGGEGRSSSATQTAPATGGASVGAPAAAHVPHDQIARRAYEIYLERCQRGQPGTPESDWKRAEAELRRG